MIWHGRVHESGAGARRARRQAHRHLGVRCVLYEMLTGRAAFSAERRSETIVAGSRGTNRIGRGCRPVDAGARPARVAAVSGKGCQSPPPGHRRCASRSRGCAVEQASCCRGHQAPTPARLRTAATATVAAVVAAVCRTVAAHVFQHPSNPRSRSQRICHGNPGRLLGPPVRSPDGSTIVVVERRQTTGLFSCGGSIRIGSCRSKAPQAPRIRSGRPTAKPRVLRRRQAKNFTGRRWNRGHAVLGTRRAGRSMVAPRDDYSRHQLPRVFRCDQQSGEPVEITRLDASLGENSHRYPVFFDGNRSCITRAPTTRETRRLPDVARLPRFSTRVIVADGQFAIGRDPWSLKLLPSQPAGRGASHWAQRFDEHCRDPAWRPSSAASICGGQVSVSDNGTLVLRPEAQDRSRLVWFDRNGRETAVVGTPTDYWQVALSPDDNSHRRG